ncbi:class I SAM-dependent methyltransferase [Paraburkholderia ginsengisoli]|uniref:Class I SAM-dependent methyltransferase n=1 Tax=Paraburkholderia ginsengisoli TaxID=311231 RepID=A0A7T4N0Q6_9BURK|nr:class I SAM-dependent methyltransferase [Paraburkholderia ginsengisoli]QQC63091.1 class I SAM-dependent methyltransferase [Paraburkholderia ginsengisoli]
MTSYQFTNTWFDTLAKGVWDRLITHYAPARILEIGSYEGASARYLIDALAPRQPIELHCIDTWEGGVEHQPGGDAPADMSAVEARFHHNVRLAAGKYPDRVRVTVHKGYSDECLARLLADGKKGYFDFVYVDGSHQAADVLADAVLGFRLLKVGGIIAFDDYLWSEQLPSGKDPLRCPKPAIDAFVNLNFRKLEVLSAPLYQLYVRKLSD